MSRFDRASNFLFSHFSGGSRHSMASESGLSALTLIEVARQEINNPLCPVRN
jgi:hypothetical protein